MGVLINKPFTATPVVMDPRDIAYLALGAAQAWEQATDEQREKCEGQSIFMHEVTGAAETLHRLWMEKFDESPVCWYYEISEPAGLAIGNAILQGKEFDVEAIVRSLIEDTPTIG